MRGIHFGLIGIVLAVGLVAWLERRPPLEQFDPAIHAEFADTWNTRVHISYWEKWGSFEADACQAMVDEFNRSQSDVFVHYIRTSQVDRKSMLASIGHDPPDVIGLWSKNVAPFAAGGALLPLDDLMKASGLSPDIYIPGYLELGRFRGRTWTLPTAPSTVALFYNKDHFRRKAAELRAAGCDPDRPPATIEELDRYAAVLNEFEADGSPRIMGFLPTEPGWFNTTWGYYFGGQLVDPQTGRVTADDPSNIRAFVWLKRYSEKYGRDKLLQFRAGFGNFDSPFNAFIEGKVSMEMQGVWFPMFIRRHRPQMDFGVAAFPCAEGVAAPRSVLDEDVIGIPTGCRHPKEAWRFIHWVETRGLETLCRLQGKNLPWRKAPEDFHQGHPNLEVGIFEDLSLSPDSCIVPLTIVGQEYDDEMKRVFEHIWSWPVEIEKAAELIDPATGKPLAGAARQAKIEELCREEITRTLADLTRSMQRKLDTRTEREKLHGGGLESDAAAGAVREGGRP